MKKNKRRNHECAQRGTVTPQYLKQIINEFIDDLIDGRGQVPMELADNNIVIFATDGSTVNISCGSDAERRLS